MGFLLSDTAIVRMYERSTGRLIFEGESVAASIEVIVNKQPKKRPALPLILLTPKFTNYNFK